MKTNLGWENLTSFCFADVDRFPKFNMVVSGPPQLTMWYDNLDGDQKKNPQQIRGYINRIDQHERLAGSG